jgi:glucose/arabinose dehydrogenase
LFIVEQRGTVRILDISVDPPELVEDDYLDIRAAVKDGGEQGLLGLAFHPRYETNGYFYVYYTDSGDDTVVARYSVSGDADDADESSEIVLMTISQPQTNHNGGWIAFGPRDGYLYFSVGDGGGSGDNDAGHTPGLGNGQDITNNLLGKILRIDVDATDGPGGNYGIPPTNPFVDVTGDDEIWSYGLRNAWRNAFDRDTGDLYIADVGQNDWEEINFQEWPATGGESFGWRCREGANDFDISGDCSATHIEPVLEYALGGNPSRCSITGGEVYRGCAIPDLRGTYFYADYCSDQIWSFEMSNGSVTNEIERTSELDPGGSLDLDTISSFGRDADGEIYILDHADGEVFKIVSDGPSVRCPANVPAGSQLSRSFLLVALLGVSVVALGIRRRR